MRFKKGLYGRTVMFNTNRPKAIPRSLRQLKERIKILIQLSLVGLVSLLITNRVSANKKDPCPQPSNTPECLLKQYEQLTSQEKYRDELEALFLEAGKTAVK